MTDPDVAVVIPAYNEAKVIRACLTAPGLEGPDGPVQLVVADNGSQDRTVEIALSYGADVVHATRRGAAAARNAGIAATDTDYVALIDADCIARAGWLPELCTVLGQSSHAGVGGLTRWLARRRQTAEFYARNYKTNAQVTRERPPILQTSNAVFRRESLEEVGCFRSAVRWCEDVELCTRIGDRGGTFGYLASAVVDSWAPDNALSHLRQYYTYGVGIEHVRALHPTVFIDRSRPGGWARLLRQAIHPAPPQTRVDGAKRMLMELCYSAGRLDGHVRHGLFERASSRRTLLRAHDRCREGIGARCCITIEGGPSRATQYVLRALRRHGATAAFFVTGEQSERHPELVHEMLAEGHAVYHSSWSGERLDTLSAADITATLAKTAAAVRRVTGNGVARLVRLPFGGGVDDPYVHEAIADWDSSVDIVQWTVDADAWRVARHCRSVRDVAAHARRAAERVLSSTVLAGSIVRLHDPGFRATGSLHERCVTTVLEQILVGLRDAAISTVPASEAVRSASA